MSARDAVLSEVSNFCDHAGLPDPALRYGCQECENRADALLAALAAAGCKIVAREPTQDIRIAMVGALAEALKPDADAIRARTDKLEPGEVSAILMARSSRDTDPIYRAMFDAAAPATPPKGGEG